MLDEMQVNDEQLDASDIRQLESADEIAHFFARLRYDVDKRINIPDYAALGMGSEDMRQHIHKIELLGKDPEDGDISIYLFEVRSVTAKLRNDIARRFRERPEKAILVLTKNYEAIEFVMLERVLSRSQSRRTALKQAIRPIPLMVNRLNPADPVALRVLKRFTFTEEDADYQWEKLRSAYMLAEWSEAYFNNRALFSDYYLKERLTDPKITPAWDEDVRPAGREIYKHIVTARKNYTRQTKDVICKGLYGPVFKLFGFDFKKQKPGTSSAGQADYLLYTPGDTSKPIAAALTYVWNRSLDDVDAVRDRAEDGGTPFEIPGARVVSLLEAQVTPWVIVTNGKLWRLYSSTASNKATNYYEIDLEEAIAANDQITALKYWWLMFRRQAFTGFLNDLLKNSADYAKELGDRLKDRVFEDIFLQFAKGFIADMRAKGVSDLDDAVLATVFSGTMTFDYIVKYIVRYTVGPVLDRKFAELEKRLRDAQRGYRKYARLVEARHKSTGRDESVTVYWNSQEMRNLVDDCLNVRVLDPAMGSGHFLVEVVDYVTNRLIDFLNGWSENPVWAFLEQTRDDILNDMERQKVTIDADRLTRVALLKRSVLKRCVYGVDLNAMAVELAKVSLWLDAFTLGAPLSFLDHHLKHGNSLIGARVADVQKALEGELTLFSRNKFAGVMLATNLMRQVSYLSDNTIEQSRQSAQAYRDARDHLAPYKRVLDVYTSRWFGNAPIKNRKGATLDLTVEFLRRDDTQAWLEAPDNPKNRLPDDDYIKAGLVAKTALNATEEKRFFHWELEFPEVFFAPSRPGGQDVQLRQDGGFDAVVGNPPYGSITKEEQEFYAASFEMQDYQLDAYVLFMEKGFCLCSLDKLVGWIIPNTWLVNVLSESVRRYAFAYTTVERIVHYQDKVFQDATVDVEVVIFRKSDPKDQHEVNMLIKERDMILSEYQLLQREWRQGDGKTINIFLAPELQQILKKIVGIETLDSILRVTQGTKPFQVGKGIPPQTQDIVNKQPFVSEIREDDSFVPLLRGSLIQRYEILWNNDYWIKFGDWLAEPRYSASYDSDEKIVIRQTGDTVIATIDDSKFIVRDNLYTIVPQKEGTDLYVTLALLSSRLMEWIYQKSINPEVGEALAQVKASHIRQFPLLLLASDNRIEDLSNLARTMIKLNTEKRDAIIRFLTWLEDKLRIRPDKNGAGGIDSLTGKTILQGYLGDYQKGEGELPWRDFYYRLYQNRNRFAVSLSDVEGEIQREYEKSLETLIPIKRDLARTDALIDKIVYRLYGLTDEEIELIELPQYEQALADAKAHVVADDKIKDDEEKIEKIAAGILPAAKRFFERVEPASVEAMLDNELPNWRSLPPDAPTFLLTGDYNLHTPPEHMDFSSSVIPYTKAVETVLSERIFAPFRDGSGYAEADCNNEFLKDFMRGKKKLTLGNFMIILRSSRETALQTFISRTYPDAAQRVFGTKGLVATLNDAGMLDIRNKAAHDEVLSRDEAQQTRSWAMQILGQV